MPPAELGRLAMRPAEIVAGHRFGNGEITGGFERRRQFLAERLRFSERLRSIQRQLLLAERDQQVGLEEPSDDERPGLPHADPRIGRAGLDQAVVAALQHERVRLGQGRNVRLLDGGARATDGQQQRCQPHLAHTDWTPGRGAEFSVLGAGCLCEVPVRYRCSCGARCSCRRSGPVQARPTSRGGRRDSQVVRRTGTKHKHQALRTQHAALN